MQLKMSLIDRGVSSDRISTRGYGEQYPVASNDTAANRQLNCRVESSCLTITARSRHADTLLNPYNPSAYMR